MEMFSQGQIFFFPSTEKLFFMQLFSAVFEAYYPSTTARSTR